VIVFTNGCFDILHRGHVEYLEKARSLGDILIVAVNSDASVRRLKGAGRPVNPLEDRMRILAALGCVDFVTSFADDTPLAVIKRLEPDILVKGADWKKDEVAGKDVVESYGGTIALVQYLKGYSTTAMLAAVSRRGKP